MYFFLIAFGLLLHVFFWGAGLSVLLMPRPWTRFWPVLAAPAGMALQSLVVWAGAYANLPGTNSYAWWSEAVPVFFMGAAFFRRSGLQLWRDLAAFVGVWVVMALGLCSLVLPLARASRGLTTMSLGSCDAADYAAGARVLMEFARLDRTGFLGLTEVVQVMSVDNFFDYWLRLNHFTPSALIALNGTILDCAPYELTSLMTVVLLISSLPVVFWLARAVMGFRSKISVWVAAIYGLSPITWYAVFHVAMGQLLAAMAIVLITWGGVALWARRARSGAGWAMSGVLGVGFVLLLGSYNFIVLVCFVPVVAWVGGMALWTGEWRRLVRWGWMMLAPLLVAATIMAERVAGLIERFMLLQAYDFGWRIPALTPEGWLGIVANVELRAFGGWVQPVLATLVVAGTIFALAIPARRRPRKVYMAICLTVPILIGYGYLQVRGMKLGSNASYDAYKLLSVFYPGILAAMCSWVTFIASPRVTLRLLGFAGVAAVSGFTLRTAYRFADRMERPPLIVSRDLLQVRQIEKMEDVASVNIRMPDMWGRLWANALLLRRPQYFYWHTYEGRLNTPLRGQWDLNGGLTQVILPGEGSRRLNGQFSLVDTRSPYFMRTQITANEGWYDLERPAPAAERWRWTAETARIRLENPHNYPLRVTCRFNRVHTLVKRDFQVWLGGEHVRTVTVDGDINAIRIPDLAVPPGGTTLEVRTSTPLTAPGRGDSRPLGFRIFAIEFEVVRALPRRAP